MDAYRLIVYVHIVLAIVLMGMGLFWLVMLVALRQRFGNAEADQWLGETRGARWPHVVVPRALRLPLPWVSWLLVVALLASGLLVAMLRGLPEGPLWTLKLVLFVAIAGIQIPMSRTSASLAIRVGFWLTLAAIVVSALAVRT
jgi:hypothetical protein